MASLRAGNVVWAQVQLLEGKVAWRLQAVDIRRVVDHCWLVETSACVLSSGFLSLFMQPMPKHSCTLALQCKGHLSGCKGPVLCQVVAGSS